MERARMLAYLELDRQHCLDSSSFISNTEYSIAFSTLHSLNPKECHTDAFRDKHKIDFRELDYNGSLITFVLDDHQYFFIQVIKKVGWEGDYDLDSQCWVKVPYKSSEELIEEIRKYIPEDIF